MTLRVALPVPFRAWGGVTRIVEGVVERAALAGLAPTVLVPPGSRAPIPTIDAPLSPLPRPRRLAELVGYPLGYPGRQRALADLLASIGTDVVVAFGLNVIDVLPACRSAGVPFVLSLNSDRRTLGTAVVRGAARQAGAVLAEGPGVVRALLGDRSPTPVLHFLPPVEVPAHVSSVERSSTLRLGMLSNLSPQKDHLLALEAVARARRRGVPVELHLAGDVYTPNPYRDQVRRRVDELDLGGVVSFTGWTSAEAFLASVDGLLITSRFEGVATSTIEGMAHGRPFLSTGVGSLPELAAASAAGRCLPRGLRRREIPELLGELIGEVAADEVWSARAGEAGRRFARDHCTWSAMLAQLRRACEVAAS